MSGRDDAVSRAVAPMVPAAHSPDQTPLALPRIEGIAKLIIHQILAGNALVVFALPIWTAATSPWIGRQDANWWTKFIGMEVVIGGAYAYCLLWAIPKSREHGYSIYSLLSIAVCADYGYRTSPFLALFFLAVSLAEFSRFSNLRNADCLNWRKRFLCAHAITLIGNLLLGVMFQSWGGWLLKGGLLLWAALVAAYAWDLLTLGVLWFSPDLRYRGACALGISGLALTGIGLYVLCVLASLG